MRERGRSSAAPEQDETTRERRRDGEGVQEDDRERLDLRDAEAHEDLLLRDPGARHRTRLGIRLYVDLTARARKPRVKGALARADLEDRLDPGEPA
jgi:hypothetical protein